MRAFIILFLSCIASLASDAGVRVTTTLSTNAENGAVYLEETFTRNGQTNLVRKTKTEHGVVTGRIQRFYHDSEFVAVHVLVISPANMARETFTTTESSYSVALAFSPAKDIESIGITRKKGNVADAFTATNGVFFPVSESDLKIQPLR